MYHQRRTGGSTAIVREQPSEAAAQAGDQSAESVGAGAREARNNRIDCLAALVLVTLVLVVTALLEPDASGYGTHEKLFMFPCLFRWLTGLPCPACGMTTALAQMARGEVLAALDAHALGPIAYLLTWLLGGRAVYGLVTGVPVISERMNRVLTARVVFGVIAVGWAINLVRAVANGG